HDAVVDDDDVALAVAMRVGILLGGTAVGGPAGVADAVDAVDGVELDGLLEVPQLALGAADLELVITAVDGETGRVVPAIFEALQAFQDDRNGALSSDIAHDSAHTIIIGSAFCRSRG